VRSLAAFRIASGGLVLLDLFQRSMDMKAFYTDQGVFPRLALLSSWADPWRFSLLLASGSLLAAWGWWAWSCACAFCWMVGYKTHLAGFLTWLLWLSWQWRAPLMLHGGDALLLLMIFWCLFLPVEALWSMDAARPRSGAFRTAADGPPLVFHAGTVALLAQVIIMYECTAFFKARWVGWTNGDAIYFALNSDFWTTATGRWLFHYPWLFKPLSRMILWYEWIGPLLLFSPWATAVLRLLAIVGFCVFQASIGASLCMGLFPVIGMAAMIPFLPGVFWDRLGFRVDAVEEAPVPVSAGKTAGVFFLFGLMIWFNLWTLMPRLPFPAPLYNACRMLAFDHRWNLFSDPAGYDGWLVVAGRLRNGTTIDLLEPKRSLDWTRPAVATQRFPSTRWEIYLWSYTYNLRPDLRSYVPAFYCGEWNAAHPGEDHLEETTVYFMRRNVFPRFNTVPPEKITLATLRCN